MGEDQLMMPQPTIHHPMIPARKSPSTNRRAVRTLTAAAGLLCLAGSLLACATTQQQAAQDLREGIDREEIAIRLTEDADRARMAGNIDRAIELYREALDYSARFPDTWNNLGLLHLERGDEAKAINAFVQASILDPTDPRPPANTGIVYSNIGRETEAMRFFHDALDIEPSYLPALRGAIKSAHLLNENEYEDLERVKRALLVEDDPQWREFFDRQRSLIESRLRAADDKRKSAYD
jgi:tetratricopeptide (TPR) repeat protein